MILNVNSTSTVSVTLGDEEVQHFTYLGSIVDIHGEAAEADVKVRIDKARVAFLQFQNIWKSSPFPKIMIFNTNV